jgi:cell pole-organizing protein PopZ
MEEILASIRRIIADDSSQGAVAPAKAAPAPAAQAPAVRAAPTREPAAAMSQADIDAMLAADAAADDDEEVLELGTPTGTAHTAPAAAAQRTEFEPVPAGDVVFRETFEPIEPPRATPPVSVPQKMPGETLLSPSTSAAVSAAFGSLATTILSDNARTLEDIVKEMMKPMLKAWLDENLPGLVERIVRAEIERVARGGKQ